MSERAVEAGKGRKEGRREVGANYFPIWFRGGNDGRPKLIIPSRRRLSPPECKRGELRAASRHDNLISFPSFFFKPDRILRGEITRVENWELSLPSSNLRELPNLCFPAALLAGLLLASKE